MVEVEVGVRCKRVEALGEWWWWKWRWVWGENFGGLVCETLISQRPVARTQHSCVLLGADERRPDTRIYLWKNGHSKALWIGSRLGEGCTERGSGEIFTRSLKEGGATASPLVK